MLSKKIGINHILPRIKDKRVLIRVDFNVPLKNGIVKDTTRINETKSTILKVLEQKPKGIILMSHLGRPNGNANQDFSLRPILPALEDILQKKVSFTDNCIGNEALDMTKNIKDQQILLLENLRFHIEEEGSKKDENGKKIKADQQAIDSFRLNLNSLGDLYINDAFGTSHRAHSSMVGINYPIRAAGDLLKKELDYFSKALEHPKNPYLVILGGAKITDKIPLINNLLEKVDEMIIGGAMAFTFLHIKGYKIGASLLDINSIPIVKDIMKKAEQKGVKLHLPVDFVCGNGLDSQECQNFDLEQGIPDGLMGLDAGLQTSRMNNSIIQNAKTIVWNGPQGAFENSLFSQGSISIVNSLINATKQGTITIAGGGDTLNLLKLVKGSKEQLSHVSTGGGASLELLEGKTLPGVAHLTNIDDL